MKCHYEVLDIGQDASEAEIKVSYRRLALKYHPDKNPDSQAEAKANFQLIQQAYEVLSDRHERAFYDKHRDSILYASSASDHHGNDCLDVCKYFSSQCYQGYGDDLAGFYGVYTQVFESIAKEDADCRGDEPIAPVFGFSNDCYEEVVEPFYAYWMQYTTRKSYVWLNVHNINEANSDRKILKLMEKENKKVRQKAKKERNEEVRSLVMFVRKRDRRVLSYNKMQEIKTLENKKKLEEKRRMAMLERNQGLRDATQAEWTKFENVTSELKQIEKSLAEEFGENLSEDDSNEAGEDLYCVACNKVFKTPKSFQNHETSKKHKENVAILKEIIKKDENIPEESSEESSEESLEVVGNETTKNKKKRSKKKKVLDPSIEIRSNELHLPTNKLYPTSNADLSDKKKKAKKRTSVTKEMKHSCAVCKADFPSKNKLFEHLKSSGHSVYLPDKDEKKQTKEQKR